MNQFHTDFQDIKIIRLGDDSADGAVIFELSDDPGADWAEGFSKTWARVMFDGGTHPGASVENGQIKLVVGLLQIEHYALEPLVQAVNLANVAYREKLFKTWKEEQMAAHRETVRVQLVTALQERLSFD